MIKKSALLIVVLISAVMLLVNALPLWNVEIARVPAQPYMKTIEVNRPLNSQEIERMEHAFTVALGGGDHFKTMSDLAMLHMYRYYNEEDPIVQKSQALLAYDLLERKLSHEPLDTFSWLRKSLAEIVLSKGDENALKSWRTSVEITPYEPSLMLSRIHIGVLLFKSMNEDEKSLLVDQLLLTFERKSEDLKRYGRQKNLSGWFLFLLKEYPEKVEFLTAT